MMHFFGDKLANLVSGLGGGQDKTTATRYAWSIFSPEQAIAAYRGDWLARKIVDIPALDQVRAWRAWQAKDSQIELLEATEARLDIKGKLIRARKLARLLGGSAIVMGIGSQDPSKALTDVPRDGLDYLHIASRYEIAAGVRERDPMSANYGQPTYFTLGGSAQRIHPSRVVRLTGAEMPITEGIAGIGSADGWGDSVLQAYDDAIKNAGATQQGIAALVLEAKVDVFKIPNLTTNVAQADYRDRLLARFGLAAQAKSLQNALIVDANEEYVQKQISFSTLPDIGRMFLETAAAAADIPVTRLLGTSAKGLNATGEGDLRNYYDRVASDQETELRPTLAKLDDAIIRSALGRRPASVHYRFNPLWQMDEAQMAEIRNLDAETTSTLAATNLVPRAVLAKAVQNKLIEDGGYPGIEGAYEDLERGVLKDLSGPPLQAAPKAPGITTKVRKPKPAPVNPALAT